MDNVLPYENGRRLPIDLFVDVAADVEAQVAADAQPLGLGQLMVQRSPRQIRGRLAAAMGLAAAALPRLALGVLRWRRRGVGRVVGLGKQESLIGIAALAAWSVEALQ